MARGAQLDLAPEYVPFPEVSLTNHRSLFPAACPASCPPLPHVLQSQHLLHARLPQVPCGSEWYHTPFTGPSPTLSILIAYPPN